MAPPVVAVAGVAPRRTWCMESAADERRNGFTPFSMTEPSISGVKETAVYRRQESPLSDRAKCGAMPRPATSLEQHFTKPLTQVHHQILHAEEKKRPKEKEEEKEQLLSEEQEEQLLSEEEAVQQLGEHKYSMLSSQQRETNAARSSPAGAALWRCFSGTKSFIKVGGTSALKSITRQTAHVEDRLQPPSTPGYAIVEDDAAGRKAARHICLLPSSQHVGDQQEFPMFLTIPCPACRHPPLFGSFLPAFGCPLPLRAAAAGQQPDQQPDKRPQDIRFAIRDSSCVHVADTTPTTTTSSSTNGLHSRSAACLPLSPLNKLNEERLSAQVGEEEVNGCETVSSFTCTAYNHSVKLAAASQPASDAGDKELLVNTKPMGSSLSREGDYAISTDHHYYTATTAATAGAAALGQECATAEQIPERFEQQVLSDEDHQQQQSSCQYCRDTGFANLHVSSVCLPRLRRGKKQAELWGLYYRLEGAKQTLMWSHDSGTDIGYLHRNSSLLCLRLRVNLFVYDYSGYGCSTPYHDPTSSVSRSRKRWLSRNFFFSRNPHNDEALFQDLLLQQQQQETSGVHSSPYLSQYQTHSLLPESSSQQQQQQQMKRHTLDEASEDMSTAVRARRSPILSTEKHALLQLQQQHGSEKEASRRAACTGELSCSIADSAEPAADSFEPPAASCSYLSSAPSSPLQQQERLQRTAAAAAACVSLEMGEEAATLSPAAVRDEDSRHFRFPKPWAGKQLGSDAAAAYYWLLKEGKARPCDIILFGDGLGVAATLVVLRRITRQQRRLRIQLRRECIPASSSSACLSRFSLSHSYRSSDSEQLCMEQQLLQLLSNEAATCGKSNKGTQHQTLISNTNSLPSAAAAEQTEEHHQQQQQQQKQQQQENHRKGRRYMDEKHRRLRGFLSRRRAAVRRQKVFWRRRTRRSLQQQQREKTYVRRNSLLLSDEEVSHWRSRPEPRSRFMKTRVSLSWKRFFNSSNAAAAADPAEMCSPLLGGVLLVASATWSWVQQQQQGGGGGDGRDNAEAEEKQGRDGFTKWQPEKQQKKEEDTSRRIQCRGSRRARVSAAGGLPYFRNASRSVHHYCRHDRAAAGHNGECCCQYSRPSSCVEATRHGAAAARCCCCNRSRDPASASCSCCCCCCSSGASATAADRTSASGNCSCCFACAFEEADRRCEFVWQSRDLLLQPRFCWGSATTLEAKLRRLSAAPLLLLQSAPLREECEEAAERQLYRGGRQTQNCSAAAAATDEAPAARVAGKGGVGVGRVCGISAGSCSTVASSGTTVGLTTGPVCQKNLSCSSDSSRKKEEEEEIQQKWVSALRRRGAGSRSSSSCVTYSFAAAQAWLLQSMEAFVHEAAAQHKLLQRLCSKCCRAKTLEKTQEKEETVDREMGGEYLSLQQQQEEKKQEEEKQQQQDDVLATGGDRGGGGGGGGGGGTKGLLPLQQWLSHRFGESEEQQRKVGDTGVSPLKKQQQQSPLKKKKGFLGGKRKKGPAASFISYGMYNEDEADTAEDEEEYRTAARTGTTTSAGKTKSAAATGSVKDSGKSSIARLLPSSATIERRKAGRGGDWDVTMGRERRQQQQEKQQQEDQSSADFDRSNSTTKSRFFSFRRRRSPPTAACSEETGGVGNRGGRWLSLTGKPGTQSMSTLFDASAAKEEDNEDHESTTPSAHRVSSPVRRRVEAAARRRGEDTGVKRRGSGDSQSSNSSSPHSSHSVVGGVEEEECAHAAVAATTSDSSAVRTS